MVDYNEMRKKFVAKKPVGGDAKGGAGAYAFRTALNDPKGTWRLVATDYITGKTASVSFLLGE